MLAPPLYGGVFLAGVDEDVVAVIEQGGDGGVNVVIYSHS